MEAGHPEHLEGAVPPVPTPNATEMIPEGPPHPGSNWPAWKPALQARQRLGQTFL